LLAKELSSAVLGRAPHLTIRGDSMKGLIFAAASIGVVLLLVSLGPDVQRYLKIRSM
jgi:hypothetical protein